MCQREFSAQFFPQFFSAIADRVARMEDAEIKEVKGKEISALIDHLTNIVPVLFPRPKGAWRRAARRVLLRQAWRGALTT